MSNCKVIALTNQKGGVGKTTTAVNLGVSLVQQGKKVLLIDADAQANLTMALGYNRPDDILITLSTVMQNIIDDKTLDVSQGIIHHSEGVDLLPSNIEMSGFEVRLINAMSRERVLKTYVYEVKKNYDYVLIDCMPSLGMITINALAAADSVIIPTQPHYLSAKGLELLLRSVSMVKRQINPKLRIDGILMTMVMPRTNISKEITATVKSAYGQKIKVFDTEIPHSIRAVEATAEGKSIFAYDKSGKVAAAYSEKLYMLCGDCEDLFSEKETWFANKIFHPYLKKEKTIFDYDENLAYFITSVNWRSLYLDILDFVENSVVGIDALECLIESEKIMNEFLRGKRNDLGKIENHIFFFDDIKELSVGASNFADLKPHATFHRGIGSYTFCYEDEKTYGTLTNMMGVILVTLYHKGQREVWNNTEILNGVGRIEAKDQQIQSVFGNELIHIMETAKKASEAMSVAQQKKAEDRIKAAGEDVKNYSVFQDWMNDMDLKNRITDK